jgi:hypothetical protein
MCNLELSPGSRSPLSPERLAQLSRRLAPKSKTPNARSATARPIGNDIKPEAGSAACEKRMGEKKKMGETKRKAVATTKDGLAPLRRVAWFPLPDFLGVPPTVTRGEEDVRFALQGYDNLAGVNPGVRVAIERIVSEQLSKAVRKYGYEYLATSRRIAAIHEAGHAVVAAAAGVRARALDIRVNQQSEHKEKSWIGLTLYDHPGWVLGPHVAVAKFIEYNVVTIGGLLAERLFEIENEVSSLDEFIKGKYLSALLERRTGKPRDFWDKLIWEAAIEDLYRYAGTHSAIVDTLTIQQYLQAADLDGFLTPVYSSRQAESSIYKLMLASV